MANTFAPFGLLPFGRRDGGSPTAGLTRCFINSSDPNTCFTGDTVKASSVLAAAGRNYVTQDTNGVVPVRGVFVGCEFFSPTVNRVVWSRSFPGTVTTSTNVGDVIAYVIDDPDQLFIAQCSTNAVIGASVVGYNIGVVPSTGTVASALTGTSLLSLSSSVIQGNVTTSASLPFRIVDVYSNYAPPGVNGTDNTVAGAIMVVAPNAWDRRTLVTLIATS